MYVCSDQQSGQWLIKATDHHRLGSGARLKATDARKLPKPIKVALRMRDKVAKNPEELLKWIKDLNPRLQIEHWRVLDRQPEPKGQRLILLIDWDSLRVMKETRYKIFTGLTQGTVKVLRDPAAGSQEEEAAASSPASTESGSRGERAAMPPSPETKIAEWKRATKMVGETSPTVKPAPADQRAPPWRKPGLLRGQ
jgi:hypothetical protein